MSTFKVGDRVRIKKLGTAFDGQVGVIVSERDDARFNLLCNIGDSPTYFSADEVEAAPEPAESDNINPAHYRAYPVEVIQLTEHMNFCRGNAVKYIARAGLKDPAKEAEDLEKAAWYIRREIERLGAL